MKITGKGQVTIPIALREMLGFLPHTEVEFEVIEGGSLRLKKKDKVVFRPGTSIVSKLKNARQCEMSTDEIIALTRT